jgi:CBS domain-containing protein
MKVRDVCRQEVVTVQPGAPTTEAARLMIDRGVGSLVVVQHGAVCGILTDRDIVARGVRHGRDLGQLPVADLMTPHPVVIGPDTEVAWATVLMGDKGIRRLPVVDDDGRLVGLLALDDVVALVGDEVANVRAAVGAAMGR